MKNKAITLFLVLTYISLSSFAQVTYTKVNYIGKTGFLIEHGDQKILIDVSDKNMVEDQGLPQETQDKISEAKAPFDDIDLILATHPQGILLKTGLIKQYMKKNHEVIFASTAQSIQHIDFSLDRCILFTLTKDTSITKVINDISIEAIYFPQEASIQIPQIGFVLSQDGKTFFQTNYFESDDYKAEQTPKKNKI